MKRGELRERIITCFGRMPRKVDLNPVVEQVERREGLRIERVTYQSDAEERVPAYVLVPEKGPPNPAIVAIHQHAGQFYIGKSEPTGLGGDADYHYALELCHRGYLTIAIDLKCFEERRPPEFKRVENSSLADGWYERFVAMNLILEGKTLQGRYVFDLSRAVDYLYTREDVDQERIGAIGHSLGGQETVFMMLYDERVKVGVSSCGIGTWSTIIRHEVGHNFAAYLPGILNLCDHDELVACIAPRPLLISAGERDVIFPIDGVRKIAEVARKAYEELGYGERFELSVYPGGHGFPKAEREKAYHWFDRWLRSESA